MDGRNAGGTRLATPEEVIDADALCSVIAARRVILPDQQQIPSAEATWLETMLQPFTFEADDRTFACQIERGRTKLAQAWWWFTVSGESHRFAPFQPVAADTVDSVRSRVLSYYRELVARRALTLDQRESWELRRKNLAALRSVRSR